MDFLSYHGDYQLTPRASALDRAREIHGALSKRIILQRLKKIRNEPEPAIDDQLKELRHQVNELHRVTSEILRVLEKSNDGRNRTESIRKENR